MCTVELVTRESGGHVVIEMSGELGIADAAKLGAVLSAAVACVPRIDVDLTPRGPWSSPSEPFWVMTWILAGGP
jgi:hypothetical protein